MFKSIITGLLIALLLGCASTPDNTDDVVIEGVCESIKGKLLVKPWLERHGRRLMLMLDVEGQERVVRAVAVNEEKQAILEWALLYIERAYDAGDELRAENEFEEAIPYFTVGLCGTWVAGDWNEFRAGTIDFEIVQLAVYDIYSGRYLTITTNFGDRWRDAFKDTDWKRLLFELGKKGVKSAVP